MEFPLWLIKISVRLNEITGGPKGWSMCARIWDRKLNGSVFFDLSSRAVNRVFFFDPDHCRKAWLLAQKPR